ncbi:hypothetical protein IH601_11625 [Candidatus Bipolaricaulota bacterium]|jgi:hypothetical protein|nr:hypothetical protein [Candidatus Bipolaricaulota bacterium]
MTKKAGGSGVSANAGVATDGTNPKSDEVIRLEAKVEKLRAHLKGAEVALQEAKERDDT